MTHELPFEESMERLEEVIEQLENADVPLEESIRLFEEGMRLVKVCGEKLDRVEQQIEILIQKDGDWIKAPFETEEEGEERGID